MSIVIVLPYVIVIIVFHRLKDYRWTILPPSRLSNWSQVRPIMVLHYPLNSRHYLHNIMSLLSIKLFFLFFISFVTSYNSRFLYPQLYRRQRYKTGRICIIFEKYRRPLYYHLILLLIGNIYLFPFVLLFLLFLFFFFRWWFRHHTTRNLNDERL